MFYVTMHSTHFIYGYNGVRHMVVKDHSDSVNLNVVIRSIPSLSSVI